MHKLSAYRPIQGYLQIFPNLFFEIPQLFYKLEDLTVLTCSPDFLNNVKICQDQLRLIMKHISLMGVNSPVISEEKMFR